MASPQLTAGIFNRRGQHASIPGNMWPTVTQNSPLLP